MLTIHSKTLIVSACVLNAVWLLAAQAVGGMLFLIPCLVMFMALVVWGAFKKRALAILLFFLPFSPLLKLDPDSISVYTLALLAVYLVHVVTGSRNVPIYHLLPAMGLIVTTLLVKVENGFSIDNSYLLFCITLLLVPYIAAEFRQECDLYWLTTTFAAGIALAAVSAQYLVGSSNITQYVNVMDVLGVVRRSGYFNDPNFYSAHITMALGGVMLLLLNQLRKKEMVTLIVFAVVLIYCGLLAVSKSFLLVILAIALLWAVGLMFQRGKISVKLMVLLCTLVGVYFLLSSAMFDVLLSRFVGVSNLSAFTTGRTDLWISYIQELKDNPLMLLFGNGYTNVKVGGSASHNTLLQSIYQFGLVGASLLVCWFVFFVRTMLRGVRIHRTKLTQLGLVFIGAFGPWLALDYLFFDELFLFPIYVCAAVRFMAQQEQAESPLIK